MSKHVRILSLDGGGMKGLFSSYFMQRFCEDAKIPQDGIGEYFDIIAGSSIGAIMGSAYAVGKTPQDNIDLFINKGPKIFTSSFGTPMSESQKTFYLGGGMNFPMGGAYQIGEGFYGDSSSTFSSVVGDIPNYQLVKVLKSNLGADTKMFQLKTNVMFTSIEKARVDDNEKIPFLYRPVIFSNLLLPNSDFLMGQERPVWQCVLSSGSAPTYFPPMFFEFDYIGSEPFIGIPDHVPSDRRIDKCYIDGGVYQNNPASLALTLANILYPNADKISVLSVGCGLGTVGYFDPNSPQSPGVRVNAADNFKYIIQVLDIAGAGAQEAVAKNLQITNLYGGKINSANFSYYRFQTVYNPMVNTELDNSGPLFNADMFNSFERQYALGSLKIQLFIQKLQR